MTFHSTQSMRRAWTRLWPCLMIMRFGQLALIIWIVLFPLSNQKWWHMTGPMLPAWLRDSKSRNFKKANFYNKFNDFGNLILFLGVWISLNFQWLHGWLSSFIRLQLQSKTKDTQGSITKFTLYFLSQRNRPKRIGCP